MSKLRINVVWFKCTDLRTHDHAALRAAHESALPILHLYVFDPFWHAGRTRICGYPKTGAIRTRFQLEALEDLRQRLATQGHELSVRRDISTARCFEELCEDFEVNDVFAFHEICSEELRIQHQVSQVLRKKGRGSLKLFWGFELYHHDDLSFDPANPRGAFNSYTSFRKRVEERSRVRPSSKEDPVFRSSEASVKWKRSSAALPSVSEAMGSTYDPSADPGDRKDPRAEIQWKGGETAAFARVQEYLWDDDCLGLEYVGATMTMDVAKSCMRDKAMSKLSPWLAHGCISPRRLYEEVKRYEQQRNKTKSTYWITHEFLWRDFVRFGSIHAGTSIFKIGGLHNQHPRWQWSTNQSIFEKWVQGITGFPFIDCFMRELKTTGYCNHMGRETAGWFLVGDLGIDWRMGAEWFESVLIDFEPTANWYNWAYRCLPAAGRDGAHQSITSAPGHQLRGLEILKWGTQHDPDAVYIKRWIPELSHLSGTVAREPWRLGLNDGPSRSRGPSLRPMPSGEFSVSKDRLDAVVAMGFDQRVAAKALYQTGEDPDAAVALLLGDVAGEQFVEDSEDEDLAQAVALSMGLPASDEFVYGVTYPKPILQPVSLMNTEEKEEEARQQQKRRDQQIASSKQRSSRRGSNFNKPHWEESRSQWSAETPTAAMNKSEPSTWTAPPSKSQRRGYCGKDVWPENEKQTAVSTGSGRRWGTQR
eukprot:TRINITY_DN27667_c0_g1_i1.p1 TRINITY_DN27667_c0_g1~~TRINITY_DN27667_c0_g1_i1.p1  ORF type:complete len:704 (+),score=93.68 TRINITY_DN27667_c0_g1_i1:146-2257(+)